MSVIRSCFNKYVNFSNFERFSYFLLIKLHNMAKNDSNFSTNRKWKVYNFKRANYVQLNRFFLHFRVYADITKTIKLKQTTVRIYKRCHDYHLRIQYTLDLDTKV